MEETGINIKMTEICRKWMKLYHKGRVSAAAMMLMIAVGMTGCGKDTGAAEQPEKITTEADESYVEEEKKLPETPVNEEAGETETVEQTEPETESRPQAGTVELTGSVRSVSADSFAISKIITEHHEDYDIAVSVAPGESGEELITVYVTDAAVYQYRTVKNAGIHPEDITSREGSYGDLQEGLIVTLKGRWEKDCFYADELVMEEFT